ncbi:MAG: preprotein translocase subunit SecG [Phycisphaerales bacterium]
MNVLSTNITQTLAVEWSSVGLMALTVLFLFACLLLILVVLIQRPQGGGLAGAFGSGAGSGQTAFGTRTGDALTVATIGLFVFYLATAVGLTYFVKPRSAPVVAPQVESAPGVPVEGAGAAKAGEGTAAEPGAAPPAGTGAGEAPAETANPPGAAPVPAPAPAPEQPK